MLRDYMVYYVRVVDAGRTVFETGRYRAENTSRAIDAWKIETADCRVILLSVGRAD